MVARVVPHAPTCPQAGGVWKSLPVVLESMVDLRGSIVNKNAGKCRNSESCIAGDVLRSFSVDRLASREVWQYDLED